MYSVPSYVYSDGSHTDACWDINLIMESTDAPPPPPSSPLPPTPLLMCHGSVICITAEPMAHERDIMNVYYKYIEYWKYNNSNM